LAAWLCALTIERIMALHCCHRSHSSWRSRFRCCCCCRRCCSDATAYDSPFAPREQPACKTTASTPSLVANTSLTTSAPSSSDEVTSEELQELESTSEFLVSNGTVSAAGRAVESRSAVVAVSAAGRDVPSVVALAASNVYLWELWQKSLLLLLLLLLSMLTLRALTVDTVRALLRAVS